MAKPTPDKAVVPPFFKEKGILFPVILLAGIGAVMVYSASSSISMDEHHHLFYYIKRHALFLALSLAVMFTAASFPYRFYKTLSYPILFCAIALLIAVLIPAMSAKAGGACRWLKIGSLTFQPAEFAKLALILFMAYSLSKKQEMIEQYLVGFLPHAMIMALFAMLIINQPDFGTVVVMGAICWGMMFVAGVKIFHLLTPLPLVISFLYFFVVKVDYRWSRVLTFFSDPWDDPYNTGYQITNSLKALGPGGLTGKGIGLGMQKMHFLPEPHTDFIFSIIGEELGLLGVISILILYGVILVTGTRIARQADSLFGCMAAAGITLYIGLQVVINTGVALGVLPTKGLTLPFISYGGTSLMINMAAMGILMNIGASARKGN